MNISNPLTLALIAAGSAILATLLTIIVSPTLQHYFWRLQRRAELRLATIDEVNRAASRFIAECLTGNLYKNMTEYVQLFHHANARVRALFSIKTALVYSKLMAMIHPTFVEDLREGRTSLGEFLAT